MAGCVSPNQLISENKIYNGMTKAALESAMLLNISFGQDIIVAGCYREYFPDTNHEIISSEKKEILYLFENVTLPEDPDCNKFFGNSLVGDGYLQGTYKSFLDVYEVTTMGTQAHCHEYIIG